MLDLDIFIKKEPKDEEEEEDMETDEETDKERQWEGKTSGSKALSVEERKLQYIEEGKLEPVKKLTRTEMLEICGLY